jgi:hypothetical protein
MLKGKKTNSVLYVQSMKGMCYEGRDLLNISLSGKKQAIFVAVKII